ncbi:MAG: PqqD family protein [Acidobacteriota bacterium]|nr:MAG: PqqD family protein [Acidobacteriota bacterium]
MTELNDTAAVIWGLADGSHSVAEIAREIERQFAVDSRQSQADTADFCQQLIEAGLLELEPDSDESG